MRILISLGCFLLAGTICPAAVITLNNQGFESGDTSGWTTTGLVSAAGTTTIDNWIVGPHGSYMAVLSSGEGNTPSVNDLESFFGVSTGLLSSGLPPGNATVGSGIYQDFTGSAGDTVTMYWAYVATDYYDFNDPAFAVVTGPGVEQLTVLASIWNGGIEVGDYGATGWHAFNY
ncbi:MAG: hypothetical protein ACUVS7_02400, partial [Bryobacteraceae bacterium]